MLKAICLLITFLLFLFYLNSCTNTPRYIDTNYDKPEIIVTTRFTGKAYPIVFEAAFDTSTVITQDGIKLKFYTKALGKLKVESGKVIACDPIVMKDGTPFTQLFPIGEFPVDLALAQNGNNRRVAFSRIFFSSDSVAKWEFALLQGQKPISLKDTSIYCYGVDGGIGMFIDSIGNKDFKLESQAEWERIFINEVDASGSIFTFGNHNLATFETGFGDGCYATFIGFNKENKPCRLLTDFGTVEWWKLKE